MKFRYALMAVLASVALFSACEEEEELGLASLSSDTSELSFDVPAGEQTISLIATRDWSVKSKPDWVAVDPDNGSASTKAQNVTITVQSNPDMDRTGNVIFTIGFAKHAVTVNQKGEAGSEEDALIYFNDFDKEASTASYGSGSSSWPSLEEFDGWKNETGNGIADVTYTYNTVTARSTSTSNSNYSDYDGSGSNNLFFGLNSFFAINEIALSGQTTFTLSFGTEMYRGSSYDNTFDHNIFHVLVSSDGEKWVELDYSFANGDPNGRWDLATSKFSIKEAVSKLYIYFKADMGSIFRIDDVKLVRGMESDVIVDFAEGKDIDDGNDNPDEPTDVKTVTIAEFLAAEESSTQLYQLTGTVSGSINTIYGNFDLVDETGKVFVYGLTATNLGYGATNDKSFPSLGIEEGDIITIIGYRGSYNGKDEVLYSYFVSKGDESEDDDLIYFNNFDKEVSTDSYGQGGLSWPYLDDFDGWKNEKGNGIANVTYSHNNVSTRSNNASNSYYSDYYGSGSNNLFFGLRSFFAIQEITLSGQTTFALSFGADLFRGISYDNTFDHDLFHVLVSSDGEKWVELDYSFANGDPNGRWDLATSRFSIKEAVSKLYIYFKADSPSIFRIDDVKLMQGTESDVIVDFAEGKDIDDGSDNPDDPDEPDDPGEPDEPTEILTVSIADFLAAEESSTQKYQLTGTVSGSINTTYGNFDLVDNSGSVYVYGLTATDLGYGATNDKSFASLGIEAGDIITIIGYRGSYNGKDEVFYAYFVSKEDDGGDEPGGGDDPGDYTGGDYTITWASSSSWDSPQDGVITYNSGVFVVTAEKKDGTTKPTVNASYNDLRAYAKNTVTISSNAIINKIVFNLSSAGLKRLAEITASEGTVAEQASGDTVVTWTGSASSVTFTVGDSAVYGTDGASKAGQLDVSSIDVNAMF